MKNEVKLFNHENKQREDGASESNLTLVTRHFEAWQMPWQMPRANLIAINFVVT